jgi:L-lactate dehydrogenase (cytochrome)
MEYSLEDIAQHDKPDDCWVTVENSVYDITKFVPKHPVDKIVD